MALLRRARRLRGTAGLRTEPENHQRARRAGARSRSPDRPRIRRLPQEKLDPPSKLSALIERSIFTMPNPYLLLTDFSGPTIYGWAVWAIEGWLAGYQASFDTAKPKLSQNNFALGYKAADVQLHTHVSDNTEPGGAIYQKVNKKTETSINLAWTAGRNNTCSGISAKYQLDCRTSLSAEVNSASLIGLGYPQTLRPGVKLTLSALICGKNFNAGGHKVGL
ncbi:hypothetical protein E2I00_013283 [Balaenoptera physalus]|uniref:Non-selective voltage-gated ion channel VDAC3 n=1 Tax=Balaenoptera physalus TaxID=9770 RepID=A0A643CDN2_BALPH|nr:hypothetical protein E2I00_013283 [Balaenoptera physalus]